MKYRLPLSDTARAHPDCERHWRRRADRETRLPPTHATGTRDDPPANYDMWETVD